MARKHLHGQATSPAKAGRPRTSKRVDALGEPVLNTSAAPRGLDLAAQDHDTEGRIKAIVQQWAQLATEPSSDDVLSVLWAQSGLSGDFGTGAEDLARRLNNGLGASVEASDITSSMTVADLVQVIV